MLINRKTLEGIRDGNVTLAFRRWKRPSVKPGGRLRTAVGELSIEAVDRVAASALTTAAARAAGHESLAELRAALDGRPGDLYRIRLAYAGQDARIALRQRADMSADEREQLAERLQGMDRRSGGGPWTTRYLRLIQRHPGRRAPDLADELGMETRPFKARVRRLKELGLTESLKVGYRLSPRGRAFLER